MSDFIYKLNAMENAAQSEKPAQNGYAAKRQTVLAYVADIESRLLSEQQKQEPSMESAVLPLQAKLSEQILLQYAEISCSADDWLNDAGMMAREIISLRAVLLAPPQDAQDEKICVKCGENVGSDDVDGCRDPDCPEAK